MYCFVILLLFNEMQMSVRRFSAIPHLRALCSAGSDAKATASKPSMPKNNSSIFSIN